MRRALLPIFVSAALAVAVASVPRAGTAAKGKKPPPPKPKIPTTIIDETKSEPKKATPAARPRVELAVCTVEDLSELESSDLLKLMGKCRTLSTKEGATATDLRSDQMLVAICVRSEEGTSEVVEITECGLKASVHVEDGATLSLGADGDLALALRTNKLSRDANPANGGRIEILATSKPEGAEAQTFRAPLTWRRSIEGYGHGRALWFPLPMFTTDFSSSTEGYRLGLTPIAVAVGLKWFPSPKSQGYLGVSGFVGWNLLVPNDTQTLSNGTFVRVNYKAAGAGVLFDAAGYFAVGVGVGRTFTTDSRTDFRTWLYFGPKLLGGLNEF